MATRIYYDRRIVKDRETSFDFKFGSVDPSRGNNSYVRDNSRSTMSFGHSSIEYIGNQVNSWDKWKNTYPSDSAVNSAIRKLESKIQGDTAQLLTAAAEWKSSLNMVAARAAMLYSAYRAMRNGDLPRVARTLGFSPTVYARQRAERMVRLQRPTEAWLEYWMGWAPSVNDIYNAIDVIQRPSPSDHRRASVRESIRLEEGDININGWKRSGFVDISYALYTDIEVLNSNLLIANQLGLLNPAQTAWELVPFSFVVDWFTNVGQVLGNLNRFSGLRLYNTGNAIRRRTEISLVGRRMAYDPYRDDPYFYASYHGNMKSVQLSRTPGDIPHAKLVLELPKMSLTRAATSISLLTELFVFSKKG